ncbi:hypothetical protein BC940DRAFT_343275 [Gongronella butleri]|nr:hypothetical protein BC940DRAFT_343275 [Gongronella butleri]
MSKSRSSPVPGGDAPQASTSVPVPLRGGSSPVLPTPSSSSTAQQLALQQQQQQANGSSLSSLQQQLGDLVRQLNDASSGIEKNVLLRQIKQLEEKIAASSPHHMSPLASSAAHTTSAAAASSLSSSSSPSAARASSPLPSASTSGQQQQQPMATSSTSSITSTGTSASEQEQLTPETMEKLRLLERDLNTYRSSLVPGTSRKEKLLSQRSNALHPLPSPSTSSMQESSSSLLPLPPPLTGTTPTKRRSKVPNNDRRNNDIEFATEIGQGLLVEVRKMQTLLQEKEEQLRALQIQKADLERAAEALTKQLRQKEEAEERLKEETWNLELSKQELTMSVTELQQQLAKASNEQQKLDKQLMAVSVELEQVRGREDKLSATVDHLKTQHEQDMASVRRHVASMQRDKQEMTKQMDVLSSELAIAKAQTRMARRSHQDLLGDKSLASGSDSDALLAIPGSPTGEAGAMDPADHVGSSSGNVLLSPSSSTTSSTSRQHAAALQQQAMEVENLKTSLSHAHRMISTLRSNMHKEKTEKFELKKLLAESQETIEQMQNDPRLWEDAPLKEDDNDNYSSAGSEFAKPAAAAATPASHLSNLGHLGSLSMELSRSQQKQQKPPLSPTVSQGSHSPLRVTPSLSMELAKHQHLSPSSSSERSKVHRSLGDELTLADAFRQPPPAANADASAAATATGHAATDDARSATGSDHDAFQDLLKGAAFGAAGTGLAGAIAKAHASRGKDALCQTDAIDIVEEKKTPCDAQLQTDQVVVRAPYETKTTDVQTDAVFVRAPFEIHDMDIQTDHVVVRAPFETASIEAQTDHVIVRAPFETTSIEAQTDHVIVRAPFETKSIEAQTDDVFVRLPFDVKHVDAQTDALPPAHDAQLQTDDVFVRLPLQVKHVDAQTDPKPLGIDHAAQHDTENTKNAQHDTGVQPEPLVFEKQEDASTPKLAALATTGAAATAPAAPAATASRDVHSDSNPAVTTKDDENASEPPSPSSPSSLTSWMSTGAAALGLGALLGGSAAAVAKQEEVKHEDASPAAKRELSENTSNAPDAHQNATNSELAGATAVAPSTSLPDDDETKRHTCDLSANPSVDTFGLPPARPSFDSQHTSSMQDMNDSTDSMHSSNTSSPATVTPPPNALSNHPQTNTNQLARHSMMAAAREKGKEPLLPPKNGATNTSAAHYGLSHATHQQHTPMVRVNPNYYNPKRASTGPSPTSTPIAAQNTQLASTSGASSSSSSPNAAQITSDVDASSPLTTPASSRPSSAMDPTISLVTETMMGHWMWKSPRRSRNVVSLRRQKDNLHQRYFWVHPYTRTLYWSIDAPGAPNRDSKTKSAYIQGMRIVPNHHQAAGMDVPDVSISVTTSDGEMQLTAPDDATHKTWVDALSYMLSRKTDSDTSLARLSKPSSPRSFSRMSAHSGQSGGTGSSMHQHAMRAGGSPLKQRPSILSGLFNAGHTPSNEETGMARVRSANSVPMSHHHQHLDDDDDDDEDDDESHDRLEDLRMCCNGKHHLSHLERDRIHPKRPKYPAKRSNVAIAARHASSQQPPRPHSVAFV